MERKPFFPLQVNVASKLFHSWYFKVKFLPSVALSMKEFLLHCDWQEPTDNQETERVWEFKQTGVSERLKYYIMKGKKLLRADRILAFFLAEYVKYLFLSTFVKT